MRRFLVRHVVIDGKPYDDLMLVTVNDDWTVALQPFEREVHSTVYVDGILYIDTIKHDIYQRPQR